MANSTSRSECHAARAECAHALAHVNEYVDGAMCEREREVIDAHLQRCASCARVATQLVAQRARLQSIVSRAVIAPTRAPASLVARVRASFEQQSA